MKKTIVFIFAFFLSLNAFAEFGLTATKSGGEITTITIASSTSAKKATADFKCNSYNAHSQFNSALTILASKSNGGRMLLSEGAFNIGGTTTITGMTNGTIIIEGQGPLATVIYAQNGSNCDIFRTNVATGQQTFVMFKNLMIQGNRSNNPSGGRGYYDGAGTGQCMDTFFNEVFFYNIHGDCIQLKQAWGARFVNCIFEDSDARGVYIQSGTDASIEGAKFINMLGNCIDSNSPLTRIIGNRIWSAGTNTVGINLTSGANYSLVMDNHFHHDTEIVGATAIQSASGKTVISNNVIESATSTATANGIILTANSSYNSGQGNIIDMSATGKFTDSGTSNSVSFNGNMSTSSGVIGKTLIVTDPYQMLSTDDTVAGNKGTPFAITLPASPAIGQKVSVFNAGAGTITLYGSGAATINGSATKTISSLVGYILQYIYTNNWIAW